MKVVIAICGSIAAYKSLELMRLLKKSGAEVKVVLTGSARHFVTPLSCQTLSQNDVYLDQFALTRDIKHITLAQWADLLIIGPATANMIGKAAHGIGDDLLSTTILSFEKPVLFVPAMDSGMWNNRVVQENVKKLREFGYHVLEPATGVLASGRFGKGRYPHVDMIYRKILAVTEHRSSLKGLRFLVSGGRTEENIDPVRVLTNRSSGVMARELMYAIHTREGVARGVFGEVSAGLPEGLDIISVRTTAQMLMSLSEQMPACDCLIMAAAVGDYRPAKESKTKIHTKTLHLSLRKNQDVLKALHRKKQGKFMIGFSLEDRGSLSWSKKKMKEKGLDMIVANGIQSIGNEMTEATIITGKKTIRVGKVSKWQLANRILDACQNTLLKKQH